MRPYDVIVDASDNVATRYVVNDACVVAGKVSRNQYLDFGSRSVLPPVLKANLDFDSVGKARTVGLFRALLEEQRLSKGHFRC